MSLDDVVMTERTARRRGRGGRRVANAGRKATAPVGGVQKNTKAAKGVGKSAVPAALSSGTGESKIIVSNLVRLLALRRDFRGAPTVSFLRAILRILFFGAWVNDLQSLTPSTLARLLSEPDAERSEVEMIKYVRPARHRGHVLDLPGKQTMRASCRPSSAKERCTLQEHVYSKYLHLIGVVDVSISKQSSENRIAQQGSGTEKVPHHTNNDHSGFTLNLVKRVHLTYGQNGVMRGIVTIVFTKPDSAAKALQSLNGVQVDKRPMKIEVVLDATKAVATAPAKGLSDRITQGKGPKPAKGAKPATNGTTTRGEPTRGRGRGRGRNAGRGKPKTADELDAEMVDYFEAPGTNGAAQGEATTSNGAAQPFTNGAGDLGMDDISLAPPRGRVRLLARPQNSFSLFRYLFPQTTKRARARISAFRHESLPFYRHKAQSRIYQLLLKRQARRQVRKAAGGGFLTRLLNRRRRSRLPAADNAQGQTIIPTLRKVMAQAGSDNETAIGRGTRRKKLAGLIKSANELRQSYQQSYLGGQNDGPSDYDNSGMPGAFPDVAIARSGDEEMILFPSYARRHVSRPGHQDLPGSIRDAREHEAFGNTGYVKQEWDRYEELNSIVDVDVRGWVYQPPKGQMSRYNRAIIALARRMSGIPAPSSSRAASPSSSHHRRVSSRHEQELVDKAAESITRKGEGEQSVAWRGGYSEAPSRIDDQASLHSSPRSSRDPSPGFSSGHPAGRTSHPLGKTSAYEDLDDAPGPGSLAKRASWNQPSEMSSAELSIANAHMMLRLKPFLTTPLVSIPLTVFFYNDKTSRSRTIYTNDAGHFNLRAALDFIPTSVRVLASDKLSATEAIHVTEPNGVSLISDVDDTIKHSAIGAGAREVFRNVFIRDLGDLGIDGVKEWYKKMANMGVKLHYVSNMPWQLYPVLRSFLNGAGLPEGSFHLKHYTGMLQGIFEPVAERKKGTLDRILSDFPKRRFILVGDSGEADLELYTEIVEANPGRILGVFIRDVTTRAPQGFFDSSVNGQSRANGARQPLANSSGNGNPPSRSPVPDFEQRPTLPPRQQTRSSSSLSMSASKPTMGKLIDFDDNERPPIKRSMTDNELSGLEQTSNPTSHSSHPPQPPSKPSTLRSSAQNGAKLSPMPSNLSDHLDRKPIPPRPPKPRKLSVSDSHAPKDPSPLSQNSTTPSSASNSTPTTLFSSFPHNDDNASSPDRQTYRSSVRNKVSSVYNALPSLYPSAQQQTQLANKNHPRPLPDRSLTSTGSSTSSSSGAASSRPAPPVPPRRNISSYPAAAAQYATNRFSGGWSGYNNTNSATNTTNPANSLAHPFSASSSYSASNLDGSADGGGGGGRNKKEELWLQRWARAQRVMERQGVVLRSWRVGGDVCEEAVRLVERVM
ncbi:MAG: hypothetical protein LQ352_005178, partial [Teloschistes flavicans]